CFANRPASGSTIAFRLCRSTSPQPSETGRDSNRLMCSVPLSNSVLRLTSKPRIDLLLAVVVKSPPALAAEIAGVDHLLEQGSCPVFRVVEALIEHIHDRQHGIEPDQVGQRQRPDRMVATELHAGIDLFGTRNSLLQREDRLVNHRAEDTVNRKARAVL